MPNKDPAKQINGRGFYREILVVFALFHSDSVNPFRAA